MKIVAVIMAIILLAQIGAAVDGSSWLGPESFLYPLKLWIEKFSLNFVFNQTEKAQRMLDMAEERLNEAENMKNNSKAFDRAVKEYSNQLNELQNTIEKDVDNNTKNIRANITEKIEEHKNRTKVLKNIGNINTIQQSIIETSSSSSRIKVNAVNGNVSVYTEGGNATVTKDGNNVTVISIANNSRQMVIVKSFQNASSSAVESSSSAVSED